jgi:hypothetical protein
MFELKVEERDEMSQQLVHAEPPEVIELDPDQDGWLNA